MNAPNEVPPLPARLSPDSIRKGSPLLVDETLRGRLCLLDSGVVYVANAYKADDAVLEYLDLLRRIRGGIGYRVEYVKPEVIGELYLNAKQHNIILESDSARQRQMLEIIKDAVNEGASDIHITNTTASTMIELRIDGLLYQYKGKTNMEHRLHGSDGQALCGALIQGMSHANGGGSYDPHNPQDARLKSDVAPLCGLQGARIATRPMKADGGNLLVMRLLYDRGIQSFSSLGFNARQISQLKEYVYRRKGAFFISGPTGGGKTTTLYAACDSIIKESGQSIRLITVEDPIESKVPGARHTELQYELSAGQDANKQAWVGAIRNCVRLDPDVMMVGEIRDLESAIGAIHFAMTGHGLLATVHTETATQILDRLREMGVDKSLLADAVIMRCLANQSLAPKNCPRCRQPYMKVRTRVPEAVRQRIETYCVDPRNVYLQGRDRACPECGGRGVKGRIAIAEIITTTQELLDMWAEHGGARMRRLWIEQGGEPKSRALVDAVCSGILDPIVGEKEVGCLMSDDRL